MMGFLLGDRVLGVGVAVAQAYMYNQRSIRFRKPLLYLSKCASVLPPHSVPQYFSNCDATTKLGLLLVYSPTAEVHVSKCALYCVLHYSSEYCHKRARDCRLLRFQLSLPVRDGETPLSARSRALSP